MALHEAATVPPGAELPARRIVRRLQPSRGFIPLDFREIWRYRELLYRFLWRDIKSRYKQTLLGPVWAVGRPLVSMVIMAAVFGGLANFKSGSGVPYPLFLYTGLLVWTYFSSALTGTSSSLMSNAGILGKAYFPRIYAPISSVTTPLVDFLLSLVIALGLFAWFGTWPSWQVVFLPAFVALALVAGLGIGLWLCGAVVRYRDIPFALPFVIQIWFYATPILYPISKLPEPYRSLILLNPMTSVVIGFRWALLGGQPPSFGVLGVSAGLAIAVAIAGLYYFRRTERTIVDLI
jgi:homopolymeric O-antigen transport system permease protein